MNYSAIIVAAGNASRAKLGYNKNFYRLEDGYRVIDKSIEVFNNDEECQEIIIVLKEEDLDKIEKTNKIKLVLGGKTRKDSVYNGLKECSYPYVLIHDGARPFIKNESINDLKKALEENDACILVHPVVETVKQVSGDKIVKTLNRNDIYLAETPQGFKKDLIIEAYNSLGDKEYTDEAMMLEEMGHEVKIVINKYDNPKLTNPKDFSNED